MADTDSILVERDAPVTIVSINRPERRNAVDGATATETGSSSCCCTITIARALSQTRVPGSPPPLISRHLKTMRLGAPRQACLRNRLPGR